ncbi:MAG TPA: hypothetical protein VGP36_25700 [Mycobacteriales bacterium]|nr:hypothetical protein [Mycobacteriales bacterium]
MFEGLSYARVATCLHVGVPTVETPVSAVVTKLAIYGDADRRAKPS